MLTRQAVEMPTLPETIIAILAPFAPLFSVPVFRHGQVLVVGALLVRGWCVAGAWLTRGRHTVANALRLMGLGTCTRFQCYHRVLNRAKWNPRHAAKILLRLLVTTLVPEGEIVTGIDETLERRRGKKINAKPQVCGCKGIYRDAVRSSKGFFVKSSGLRSHGKPWKRWISLMLFAWVPWAKRVWALRTGRESRRAQESLGPNACGRFPS